MTADGLTLSAAYFFEDGLGGGDAVVLGFFEDGDAAEVGVGEEEAGVGGCLLCGDVGAFGGEDCAGSGADHGVAHAHDVDARNALANVGVDAFEIVEDGFFPVGPIFFKEQATILRGVAVGKLPIKGPDRFVDVGTDGLVCGVNVAEGG